MEPGSLVSVVRSKRVLVGDEVCPAVIVIKEGKIQQILSTSSLTEDVGCEVGWLSLFSLSFLKFVKLEPVLSHCFCTGV